MWRRMKASDCGLSQLSIKTRIETRKIQLIPDCGNCLSQLSIKTRIETKYNINISIIFNVFESAIH